MAEWIADNLTPALLSPTVGGVTLPGNGSNPQQATVFALIYGTPLLSFHHLAKKLKTNLDKLELPTNIFYHQPQLASPDFNDINRPNVDTLYSEAMLDLSAQNVVVTIPDNFPDDRFYVFPIYDVYGNNIVNLGPAGDSKAAGNYLVSFRPSDGGYKPSPSDDTYAGYVYLPTVYGIIDLRIQVNSREDVPVVRVLQNKFKLAPTEPLPEGVAPPLTNSLLVDGLEPNYPEKILDLTARLSPWCPTEAAQDNAWVTSTLQMAGLMGGSYQKPDDVNLTNASEDAIKAVASVRHSNFDKYFRKLNGDSGWSQLRPEYSGDFKNHFLVRAFVAAQGYLQLKAHQAIYPIYDASTNGLNSDKAYTVTFSKKPPVNGFWSLTVYNEKAYLVKNHWNIYSVSDRSGIKYPDGSLVYGTSEDKGKFTILLQSTDTPPPENYRSNWIPTPESLNGGKKFNFTIRWYGPTPELEAGDYPYPVVSDPMDPIKSD